MMRYPKAVALTVALASSACDGGGPSQPEQPALAITYLAAVSDRDSAVVEMSVTTWAAVRFAYVVVGQSDTAIVERNIAAGTAKLIIRPLRYNQSYHLKATATAEGQPPATAAFNFVSDAPLNPCSPRPNEVVPLIDLNFEYRPQPNPDKGVYLEFVDGTNCDQSAFSTNDLIFSLDNGYSIKRTYRAKPNLPFGGNAPLTIRVGLFRPGKFVRWLEPSDFTLNGKSPSRVTEERPAPPNCIAEAECKPGRAVAFNLDATGVVDP
jgi:hypothetical protein